MPDDPHAKPGRPPELDPLRVRLSSGLYPTLAIGLALLGAWAHAHGWL